MAAVNDVTPTGASEVNGPEGALNNLLFVVEDDRRCLLRLQRVIELAVQCHATLSLVYVIPRIPPLPPDPAYVFLGPKEHQRQTRAWAERILGWLVKGLARRNVRAQAFVRCGEAVPEIIRLAKVERADALVVCTEKMTRRPYLLGASAADKLIRLTGRPLLILPSGRQ